MKKIRSAFLASLAGMFLLNTALVCAEGSKLVLGTKVEKHVMQNERDHFAFHDGQVWAQIELKPSTDGHVTFVWTRDGKPYTEFKTATKKSDRYRTQAFVTAHPGKWHVAVKSDANVVLAEKDFSVDGMDGVTEGLSPTNAIQKKSKEKADIKPPVKDETKTVSGINEALKALNPTDSKPEVKANEKPAAKSEPSPEKVKVNESLKTNNQATYTKSADAKPTDAKPGDAKPTDGKSVNTKEADVKSAVPKG
ncbi:MAG: DUF2914 domain-containing protein [Pseudomonadota bacterium]